MRVGMYTVTDLHVIDNHHYSGIDAICTTTARGFTITYSHDLSM